MSRMPEDAAARKAIPLATGLLDYFPDALLAVAALSKLGNEQHNPGEPLHWAKEKSTDEPDALMRHLIDRGKFDTDGVRHSAKVAWRALAMLQRELDVSKYGVCPRVTEPKDLVHGTPEKDDPLRRNAQPPLGWTPGLSDGVHREYSEMYDKGLGTHHLWRLVVIRNGVFSGYVHFGRVGIS